MQATSSETLRSLRLQAIDARRRLVRVFFFLPFTAVIGLTAGCQQLSSAVDTVLTAGTMSPEQEVQFGQQVAQEIEKDLEFVNDAAIQNYVQQIGQKVVANSPHQPAVPVQFRVIRDDSINAFAIPGGNIYVNTGLIYAAEDEAELASVLAHELGHVVYRHGAQQVSRATTAGVIQQVILGQESAAASQLLSEIAAQGTILKYGREAELEADAIAIPTLYGAKYDPSALVSFFQTLQEEYGSGGGQITFFASHPATQERIDRAQQNISALPGEARELPRPVNELRQIQSRIQQLGLAPPA